MLPTKQRIPLIIVDFFLPQPKLSMPLAIRFSKTAITVERLAKVIKRKKRVPHILPPAMLANTFGSVMKIREGPASGSTLKLKHAGKMIRPDITATKVSSPQIRIDSLARVLSFDI